MVDLRSAIIRLPDGDGCAGMCTEDVLEALRDLRVRMPDADADQLGRLAHPTVVEVLRRRDARDGLYARLDRLLTAAAPAWWRQAFPDESDRRWLVRLLWWCRSADPMFATGALCPLGAPWHDLSMLPLVRWADHDGTTTRQQSEIGSRLLARLDTTRPAFAIANVVAPLARKSVIVSTAGAHSVAA